MLYLLKDLIDVIIYFNTCEQQANSFLPQPAKKKLHLFVFCATSDDMKNVKQTDSLLFII